MTNDLISRSALSNEVEKSLYENPHSSGVVRVNHNHEHQHFLSMVANAPAVDAVEIVRCKDCGISCESRIGENWIYCQNNEQHHKKQHFCSYGKRRESEVINV